MTQLTALITGGGRRLGHAMSLGLASNGIDCVIHYNHSRTEAEYTAQYICKNHGKAWTLHGDLSDSHTAEELITKAQALTKTSIDILINNAGIFPEDTINTITEESLIHAIRINTFAPLRLSRMFSRQKNSGIIINMLDARMIDYDAQHESYHLSKRLLQTLTRQLAHELAPHIRVNAIAPGLILPPDGANNDYLTERLNTNPLQTHGTVDDIVRTAIFLIHSPFITGQTIFVDGGRNMRGHMYD